MVPHGVWEEEEVLVRGGAQDLVGEPRRSRRALLCVSAAVLCSFVPSVHLGTCLESRSWSLSECHECVPRAPRHESVVLTILTTTTHWSRASSSPSYPTTCLTPPSPEPRHDDQPRRRERRREPVIKVRLRILKLSTLKDRQRISIGPNDGPKTISSTLDLDRHLCGKLATRSRRYAEMQVC